MRRLLFSPLKRPNHFPNIIDEFITRIRLSMHVAHLNILLQTWNNLYSSPFPSPYFMCKQRHQLAQIKRAVINEN